MASPDFPEPPPSVPATPIGELDRMLDRLYDRRAAWVATSIPRRLELLRECLAAALVEAPGWVDAACRAKGIRSDEARAGEEWLGGPMTFVRNLRLLIEALEAGGAPKLPLVTRRPDGQVLARVFPASAADRLMFAGVTADVYIEPGQDATQGRIYREKAAGKSSEGGVGLVLGAGNVASIGPMDALYKLFVDDEVVILKTNPVNAYLGPFIERSFAAFSAEGFFAIAHGGAEVGQHLCNHPKVHSIHITGSDATHDAIVWGADPAERARRKAAHEPINTKPISSELGCVTPVLVVPGPWSESDLDYQAQHVASMVANNASFNCNAAKVVVTAAGWPLRERFLRKVRDALAATPARKAYYPGAGSRYTAFLDHYPQAEALGDRDDNVVPWTVIPNVAPTAGEYALTNEAFCGVLADVALDATTADEFLPAMTKFANDDCWGTLSCMVLIHPQSEREHRAAYERAIDGLRYGGIAVNCWAGLIYGLVVTPWGAHPGHTLEDIQSGRGVVHNAFLLDHVQKTVVKAPFRINPKPAWFSNHKTQAELGRALLQFEATGSMAKLPKVVWAAMRG
ncbi:MAG: aldehyde dehydrogenase family protein [Myxococcales bacterium]|nr:aldehyde dehydrogenase family protein [Myxococcales bacterium]MCB9533392.1 aldehyde dehydrogenase family protein [Myxococcales bacterium]